MRILQCFQTYLPDSQNWAYNIIKHVPYTNVIGARQYNGKFNDEAFEFIPARRDHLFDKFTSRITDPYLRHLMKYAKKIDVMHSHFANTGWFHLKVAEQLQVPHVVSFYGWDYEKLPFNEPEWEQRYQELFQKAQAFVCEGDHGAELLLKKGCPESKVKVVKLGVKTAQIGFHPRAKAAQHLHLVQVASFAQKKGHEYTVKAFAKALQQCPNMQLTLVGKGNLALRQKVIDLIAELGIGSKVHLQESIDFKQLHTFLQQFDGFIHPSCYSDNKDSEGGAPIVLLDAQATGLPVIATRHCDIPCEVIHEQTGWLAPEKDVEQLAQYIEQLYHMEQEEYHRFATRARKHVEENYDIVKNSLSLQQVYDALV